MGLYCGIDLHSNNHVVTVIDEADRRLYEKCHLSASSPPAPSQKVVSPALIETMEATETMQSEQLRRRYRGTA